MAKTKWADPAPAMRNAGQAVGAGGESVPMERPMAEAKRDDMLEVKLDGGWFSAKLEVEDEKIKVSFVDYDGEIELWPLDTVKSANPLCNLVRVESPQLQDADCGLVSLNRPVCALYKHSDHEGWYDATVMEIRKKEHLFHGSNEICTCSFTLVWNDGPQRGKRDKVKCDRICLISVKDIETHPVILDILRHGSSEGGAQEQEEEIRRSVAMTATGSEAVTRSEIDTDGDQAQRDEVGSSGSFCEEFAFDIRKELVGSIGKLWTEPQIKPVACEREDPLGSGDKSGLEPTVKACVSAKCEEQSGSLFPYEHFLRPSKNWAEQKANPSARQAGQDHAKRLWSSSSTRQGNEQLMVRKSCADEGVVTSGNDPVCIPDEEVKSVHVGAIPATTGMVFANSKSGIDVSSDDWKGSWNADSENPSINIKYSVKQLPANHSGCVLMIDNLELGVQPADVLEQLSKFSRREKIHSVHIPPPYPGMSHALGYVVYTDKETVDSAVASLSDSFVVSSRGRPWIVERRGDEFKEEHTGFATASAFMGEEDGKGGSLEGLKTVTKNEPAYNAVKKRLFVTKQHRAQSRVMFKRHAQEESELDANPHLPLYG